MIKTLPRAISHLFDLAFNFNAPYYTKTVEITVIEFIPSINYTVNFKFL